MSNPIDLDSKYMWAINNADIDAARDLRLTAVKKYWKRAGQIKKEVDGLYRDWISALAAFMKHSWRTHNKEEVTENMKIKQEVDTK